MSTLEVLLLSALGILFVAVAWWARHSTRRAHRVKPLDPDLASRFTQRTRTIGAGVIEGGLQRLVRDRAALVAGSTALRQLLALVRALARKLHTLRGEQAAEQHVYHEWDYLAAAASEQFPWLAPWLTDLDLPTLTQASESEPALGAALEIRLDSVQNDLEQAATLLAEHEDLALTQADLIVLGIIDLGLTGEQEAAAARCLNLRPSSPEDAAIVRAGLALALSLLHATPRSERVTAEGLLVPPLADTRLAASLVRHRVHSAGQQDDLSRARALLLGDPDLLWLALAVVEKNSYPEEAACVYGELAALVRRLATAQDEAALVATATTLATAAERVFGRDGSAALLESARQLRAGRHPFELFGGVELEQVP